MMQNKIVFSGLCALFIFVTSSVYAQNGADILRKSLAKCAEVKGLSYCSLKQERIKGKMIEEKMDVKLQRAPLQLYLKKQYPEKGLEVLFVQGKNNNNAVINPGSLLPTLKLDPNGSLMRKNQHHTVFASGYDHLASIFQHIFQKHGDKVNANIKYCGSQLFDGKDCHKLELVNPQFQYQSYTIQANENLITIARKFKVSEHMVLEKNEALGVDDYTDVKPGQKILIPSEYAQKTIILIDKTHLLPVSVSVYDDKGLYEKYDFQKLKVNPSFSADEFTEKYAGYGF